MRKRAEMQKLSRTNNLDEFLRTKYDSIIMVGIKDGDMTIMSSKDHIFTTAMLEWATNECMLEVFPHMRDGYEH